MISSRNENNACEVRSILEKLHKMRIITVNEILDIFHNIQHNNHHHYWNGIIHCLTYTKTAFNFVKYGTTGPTKPLDVICEIPMRIVDMNIFLSTKNQDLNPIVDFRLSYWTNSLSHKLCKPCMCSMLHAPYTVFGFRHFIVFHTFCISDYSLFKINSIRFWTNHVSNARISDFTKQNKCWEPRKGIKKGKKWTRMTSKCFMNSSDQFSTELGWCWIDILFDCLHCEGLLYRCEFHYNFRRFWNVCHSLFGVWNSVRLGNTARRVNNNGLYVGSSEWGMFNSANS